MVEDAINARTPTIPWETQKGFILCLRFVRDFEAYFEGLDEENPVSLDNTEQITNILED